MVEKKSSMGANPVDAAGATEKKSSAKRARTKKSESKAIATVANDRVNAAAQAARERAMEMAKQRAQQARSKIRHDRKTTSEKALTAEELKSYREMLIAMRHRLSGQIAALRSESLTRDDEVNPEEDGTDAFERLFSLERAGSEQDIIFEIDEALRRLDEGGYGGCESCEKHIERARLKALPFVKNCIDCQSMLEGDRSGYTSIRARFL